MLYGGHTYLFPVLHIGPDPGIASMLFSHQVLINALLDVAHHKQGSTHVTHLHSLLRLIWLLLKLALQMIHHKSSVNMPSIFSLLSFIFFIFRIFHLDIDHVLLIYKCILVYYRRNIQNDVCSIEYINKSQSIWQKFQIITTVWT